MPISLTCSCGSKLEIDDKFAGQPIPCPDCNKPLLAEPPPPPATSTSGLAILSLVLALIGAFTIVGTLAAMACGAIAHRRLSRKRGPVGGIRIAQAGMILGAVFTVLAVAAYALHNLIGLDSLARQYVWAGKLEFPASLTISKKRFSDDRTYVLDRPSHSWGSLKHAGQKQGEHLLLVNVRDDAQLFWFSEVRMPEDDAADLRSRVRDSFLGSELLRALGRLPDNASETTKERDVTEQEFLLDLTLGGIKRTFLFQIIAEGKEKERQYVNVLVGGARVHRFAGLRETLQKAMSSFKPGEVRP